MKRKFKIPGIGQRSIKTAMAVMLCACFYAIIQRNPTFACIGVIFGIGSDLQDSILNGGNRFIGTVIGGFLGMGLFALYVEVFDQKSTLILLPMLFVGTLLLIMSSLVFKWPGAVQPGGVVLCIILYNTKPDVYISYSLNRMLDTFVGVAFAILVNILFSRSNMDKLFSRKKYNEYIKNFPEYDKTFAEVSGSENDETNTELETENK